MKRDLLVREEHVPVRPAWPVMDAVGITCIRAAKY